MRRVVAAAAGGLVVGLAVLTAWPTARAAEEPASRADPRPSLVFAIADDWSWPHAGAYGDRVVKTPTFDRLAREGVLFNRAFCASPSCTPSRGAILTGQAVHRLKEGGNLWSILPAEFRTFPDLLEAQGYHVGLTGKGWGPGRIEGSGRDRNPAGPRFQDFGTFLKTVPDGQPFCYWFGSTDPHRPYKKGSGVAAGKRIEDIKVPPFLPDTPEVRSDILDYAIEVERFDRNVGSLLDALEKAGRAENTIIVMTSDNGMPFPRAKANLYEAGTHMPLVVGWPAKVRGGQTRDDFVSFTDFAPTFLQAAGIEPLPEMTGRSFLDLLTDEQAKGRDRVFLERERHANVREGDLSYPCRAVRTSRYLYIRNLRPDRWPAGDPQTYFAVGPFGDIDGSPTKQLLLDRRDDPAIAPFFHLACDRRPAEELYDLEHDPWQLKNIAGQAAFADAQRSLRAMLDRWMTETGDPLATGDEDPWDHYPYYGGPAKHSPPPASPGATDHSWTPGRWLDTINPTWLLSTLASATNDEPATGVGVGASGDGARVLARPGGQPGATVATLSPLSAEKFLFSSPGRTLSARTTAPSRPNEVFASTSRSASRPSV